MSCIAHGGSSFSRLGASGNPGAVQLCNYTDVYYNDRITPDMGLMETTATASEIRKFHLEVGDVVITKDSEEWSDIAVPAIVLETAPDLVCGYHLAVVRSDQDKLVGDYVFRAFRAGSLNQQFQVAAEGVTRYGLPKNAIGEAVMPFPPLAEQRAIANFLESQTAKLDSLIAKKQALIAKLKEKRAALISRVVTRGLPPEAARAAGLNPHPKLKPSGIDWLGDVPEHWQVKSLRYVGDAIIGLTYEPGDVVDENEGILVLRASNVSDGRIVLDDKVFVKTHVPERLITKVGDILICSRSGSRALIGKNAMIGLDSAGLTFGTFMTLFRSQKNEFLYFVFNSRLFEYQSSAFLTATINQLTVGSLYDFKVPIPVRSEAVSIANFLSHETSTIDRVIFTIERAIDRLNEYRAALITNAVTGKIDVREVAT